MEMLTIADSWQIRVMDSTLRVRAMVSLRKVRDQRLRKPEEQILAI